MRRNNRSPCGVSAKPEAPPIPFQIGSISPVIFVASTVIVSMDCDCSASKEENNNKRR